MLMIGERLRTIRESKRLSQGDIEKRTGMLRFLHLSRRERPHGSVSIDTLPKYARHSRFRCISFSTMVMPRQRRSRG